MAGDGLSWSILVRGFGVVKGSGPTRSVGVDVHFARFVMELRAAGHDVQSAELLSGKSDDYLKASASYPATCTDRYHAHIEGSPQCVCGKLKPRKNR